MILRRIYGSPFTGYRTSYPDLSSMRQQMDQIFNALSGGFAGGPAAGVFPLTNVTESKDSYCVRAELPGIVSDDLDIQVTSNGISLSGERKIAEEGESVQYHRREREAGKFSRLIELPGEVDTDKVEASLKNGILTISVPKSETAKPRQITIK